MSRSQPFRTHSTPVDAPAPLMGVALCLLTGCALAAGFASFSVLHLAAGVFTALACALFGPHRLRTPATWLALALCAWAYATPAFSPTHPESMRRQMDRPAEFVEVYGWVRADPVQLRARNGSVGRWRVAVECTSWKRLPHEQPVRGQITVWTDAPDAGELRVGDALRLAGPLTLRPGPGAGLHRSEASMDVTAPNLHRLPSVDGPWWLRAADSLRRACAERLRTGLDHRPEALAVWLALLLGYRHDVPEPLEALFSDTGTFHLFAISGLHVGLVAVILTAIARVVRIPQPRWVWLMLPGLLVFAACTGFRASTVRAVIMALAWFAAPAVQRRPHGLSAWALAVIIILAVAPTQITDLGFQFSFGIVLGLMLLYRPLTQRWTDLLQRDPWALDDIPRHHRIALATGRHLVSLAGLSLCAWIISAPLMAAHFGRLAPGGLLANLLVVPLAFVTVTSGMLSLLTGWIWPWLGETFNYAGLAAVEAMLLSVRTVADLPGATARLTAPPVILAACWYVWFAVVGWRRKAPPFAWALLVLLLGTAAWIEHHRQSQIRVTVLNAGGSASTLVQHNGKTLLVDPGPQRAWARLERDLEDLGVTRVDTLILTHGLSASAGGVPDLLRTFPVGEVWFPSAEPLQPTLSAARNLAVQKEIPVLARQRGDAAFWHGSVYIETLAPGTTPIGKRAGDHSLILRLSSGTHSLLLQGGATGKLEGDTLIAGIDPEATTWIVTTSDDRDAVSTTWTHAIWPQHILVPRDAAASFFGPRRDRLDRLNHTGAEIIRLGEHGRWSTSW